MSILIRLFKKFWNTLLALVCWAGVFALFATVAGFLGEYHWRLDILSHFRLLYCYLLGLGFVILIIQPHYKAAAAFLVGLVINLSQIMPLYFPDATLENTQQYQDSPQVLILQTNIWASNEQYQKVVDYVRQVNPDIWAVEEYSPHHQFAFNQMGLLKEYPYSIRDIESRIILFSKLPMRSCIGFAPKNNNAILLGQFDIEKNNKRYPLLIAALHPERPNRGSRVYRQQIAFFQRVLELTQPQSNRQAVIVMGDFNTTPWSYPFRILMDKTGLKNSQQGYGAEPTYPRYLPKLKWPSPFTLLPIDHALVNDRVVVLDRKRGPDIGSDHLPVVLKVALR